MSDAGCPWLPAETPVPGVLDARLSELFGAWAQAWFAETPPALRSLAHARRDDLAWRTTSEGLMLGLASDAPFQLGRHILGLGQEGRAEADRGVIEEVAEEALVDLRARLAGVAGAPRDAVWRPALEPAHRVAVLDGLSPPVLAIGLTATLFAKLARAALPPTSTPELGTGIDALARQRVALSAAAGRCRITVAELAGLTAGDVLILDSDLGSALPLVVSGARLARGSCAVVPGTPPALRIEQSLA